MSLRGFHIFFIVVAVLLTTGFAVWEAYNTHEREPNFLAAGVSLVVAVALIVYLYRFITKKTAKAE